MAKWGEIKCERCAAPPISLWDALARQLEESDAREARLNDKISMLEEHLCLAEEKLAQQDELWEAFKHWEGERKYALRIIVKWLKNTPGAEAEGSCAPHADGSSEDAFVQAEEDSNVAHSVERHAP